MSLPYARKYVYCEFALKAKIKNILLLNYCAFRDIRFRSKQEPCLLFAKSFGQSGYTTWYSMLHNRVTILNYLGPIGQKVSCGDIVQMTINSNLL